MADYYTKFSFVIPLESEDEKRWVREVLHAADSLEDSCFEVYTRAPKFFDHIVAQGCHGNAWAIQSQKGSKHVWIHHDESGDVDAAALFAQVYLKRFHPDQVIAFEWSNDCSKGRLNAFGGGACVVTTKKIYSATTLDCLYGLMKKPKAEWRNEYD